MKYRTIVVDPPWSYLVKPRGLDEPTAPEYVKRDGTATRRRLRPTAEGQYATMSNAQIAVLPVGDLAAEQAHLYLWVTNPRLYFDRAGNGPTPAEMMAAWGFDFTSVLTWHKLGAPGMGWYFRGDTEHVLFGVKGRLGIPAALRVSNHFAAPRTGHSAKPDRFYEIVERVSPEPRLEMFARRRRVGWNVWGDEAPPESEARTQTHLGLTG